MNLQDGPPCPGTSLRESHPATPEAGQYDSPDMDDPEEDFTSQADFDSEDEYTDATGHSGRFLPAITSGGTMPCIERGHARNIIFIEVV